MKSNPLQIPACVGFHSLYLPATFTRGQLWSPFFFPILLTCEPTESLPPSPGNAACVCLWGALFGSVKNRDPNSKVGIPSLKLTAFSHLNIGQNPKKGKQLVFQLHPFSGAKMLLGFRERERPPTLWGGFSRLVMNWDHLCNREKSVILAFFLGGSWILGLPKNLPIKTGFHPRTL